MAHESLGHSPDGGGVSPAAHRPDVVLVTGGAGFIGSHLIRWILEHEPRVRVINLDLLTYSGNLASLADVNARFGHEGEGRYFFVRGDIRDVKLVASLLEGGAVGASTGSVLPAPDTIMHLAAQSHVDRSIAGPEEFVSTNVQGTLNVLMCARSELAARPRPFRIVNASTDEVYGSMSAEAKPADEDAPLRPNSPYAASKAGADCLVRAFANTYALPCLTTRSSNNYGPNQFPEKLIPLMIVRALADEALPVYGDGMQVRDWLHVLDHASALWAVCTRGDLLDEVYNVSAEVQVANIDLVARILRALRKPETLVRHVTDRAGHDRRYALDSSRLRSKLGWAPAHELDSGLKDTIDWYVMHQDWWRDLAPR